MQGSQELNSAGVYTDLQGLAKLRMQAKSQSADALKGAASQFEAMFLQMMLKSMRAASLGEGLFDNNQSQLYQDMYDKQLSLELTQNGKGVGLADMLVNQLKGTLPGAAAETTPGPHSFPVPLRQAMSAQLPRSQADTATQRQAAPATPSSAQDDAVPTSSGQTRDDVTADPISFDSPESFLQTLWPHAQRAAKRLGVDPKALLAQAALETGWGKAVIRRPDGSSSHNLFNIKADQRWDGERAPKLTLEYRGGLAVKEQALFRSYGSYAESFDDYADFISSSPRYQDALRHAHDPLAFLRALQGAGYATDPRYADKISDILSRPLMKQAATSSASNAQA